MSAAVKSDKLKKLETELNDLTQWLKLGLVPKKDLDKHKTEMKALEAKIEEEKHRLLALKESGEAEEYVTPKRNPSQRAMGYPDTATIADIDLTEESSGMTETTYEMETETMETESYSDEKKEGEAAEELLAEEDEEEEDPFSDKNRWKRGVLDPDADNW